MHKSSIFDITNMSFNIIHENKILAKNSEFIINTQRKYPFNEINITIYML